MGDNIAQDTPSPGISPIDRPAQVDSGENDNEPELEIVGQGRDEFETESKIVLILCGLIASGKSTFAEALETHFPQFRRCNQDDLGSRQRVERLAREYLGLGYSICIDRTNFDAGQRAHWIKIAHEFPGTLTWVIVFDTPYEICARRLRKRTSHPTIKSAEEGLPILARFANDFRHPRPYEGYNRILYLQPPSQPAPGPDHLEPQPQPDYHTYTKSEVSSILRRVRGSPAIMPPPTSSASDFTFSSGFSGHAASVSQRYWSAPSPGRSRSGYGGIARGLAPTFPAHGQYGDRGQGNWGDTTHNSDLQRTAHDRQRSRGSSGSSSNTRSRGRGGLTGPW